MEPDLDQIQGQFEGRLLSLQGSTPRRYKIWGAESLCVCVCVCVCVWSVLPKRVLSKGKNTWYSAAECGRDFFQSADADPRTPESAPHSWVRPPPPLSPDAAPVGPAPRITSRPVTRVRPAGKLPRTDGGREGALREASVFSYGEGPPPAREVENGETVGVFIWGEGGK